MEEPQNDLRKAKDIYTMVFNKSCKIIADVYNSIKETDSNVEICNIPDPLEEDYAKPIIHAYFPFEFQFGFIEVAKFFIYIVNQKGNPNIDDIEVDISDFETFYPFIKRLKDEDLVGQIYFNYRDTPIEPYEYYNFIKQPEMREEKYYKLQQLIGTISPIIDSRMERMDELYSNDISDIVDVVFIGMQPPPEIKEMVKNMLENINPNVSKKKKTSRKRITKKGSK